MSSIASTPSSPTPSTTQQIPRTFPGRIIQLELLNFKSYKGTHVIGPLKQFSCIVGPNGSGKSNLMDAISFVMGLRAQHLRSTKLSKLIYHGDGDEKDSSVTEAHVTLLFETPQHEEMKFRRQVNREGVSQYFIDDRTVSASAYDEKLESFGVLSKAKNFLVFQGDVESIASKSPMELTKLIERVSKSDEFKKEYDRLKSQKEAASELVVQNFQKKKTVNQEKTKYKLHKKEAEEFEKLASEHSKKQTTYVLWRLYHIEKKVVENRQQLTHLENEHDRQRDSLQSLNAELAAEKKRYAAAKAEMMKRQNTHKKHIRAQRKFETESDRVNVSLKHSQQTIEKIKKQIDDAKRSNKERQREIEQLENKIREAEEARNKQLAEIEESTAEEHEELPGDLLEEYNELKKVIGRQTINFQEDLDRNQTILDSERQDERQVSNRVQMLTEKLEGVQKRIDAKEQRFDKINILVNAKKSEKDGLERRLRTITEKHTQLDDKKTRIREELGTVAAELVHARVEENENERDTKMNQALESMKNHFTGVYGKLSDLFNIPSDRHRIPVFVALGNRNRNAIVTDTEKTAIDCIKYLKEQRVPPMVFIPLDTIQAPRLNESLRNYNENGSQLVMDVIAVKQPQYEPALRFALGNTLLFKNMDSAMSMIQQRGKLKCVTEDGTIFSKSGFITGGKEEIEQAINASSHRSTKSESDTTQLTERRDTLVSSNEQVIIDLQKLDKEEQAVKGDIQSRDLALKFMNNDLETAQTALEAAVDEKKQIQDSLNNEQRLLTEASNRVRTAETTIGQINEEISKVEDGILADFNAKIGYNMREYEHERQARKHQMLSVQTTHNQAIARLSESLEYAKSLFKDDEAIQRLEDDLQTEQNHAKELAAELKKYRDDLSKSEKKAADLRKRLDDAKKDMQDQNTKIHESIKKIQENHQRLQSIQKKITNISNAINILRNKRSQLVTQCLVEEIELPTVDDTESTRPKKKRRRSGSAMDTSDEEKNLRSEAIEIQLAGEEEEDDEDAMRDIDDNRKQTDRPRSMCLDFSNLPNEICTITSQEQYQNVEAEFKSDLARLINEIEKLAPSVKSSKRYEGVKEKLNKTASDLEKAKEDSKKAAQDFEEIKERRYRRFMNAFKPISKAIDDIYKELTKSEAVPLGGTAYLGLDQEDEPYLQGIKYNAMPPLKRYRDIDQLSGGERTVAALALLFAIHRYRPSPFFILDEVDAALDNVNVNKVAHYIHRSAAKRDCQFIVISLKENFFATADSLVGVCKDQQVQSSGILTMDLGPYYAVPTGNTQRDFESDQESIRSGASGKVSRASSGHISDI